MNRSEKRRQLKLEKKAARRPVRKPSVANQELMSLAVQHHNAGRLTEAEGLYGQILQADPQQPVALHMRGVIALQYDNNDIAVDFIKKALVINPADSGAHCNLGIALKRLGRMDEAADCYRRAIKVSPDFSEAHSNLGNVLSDLGDLDEAVACYQRALSIKPANIDALSNMGVVLEELGRTEEAAASHRKAIAINPDYAEAHANLSIALKRLGKFDEAVASCKNAIALKPDFAKAYINLGNVQQDLRQLDDAVASFSKAIAIQPDHLEAYNSLLLTEQYRFCNLSQTFADACRYGELVAQNARPIANHANSPEPERRLRVGLVSGDFHHHPVGYFLSGVFSEFDDKTVELYVYSTLALEDDVSAEIKSHVAKWQKVLGVSDQQLTRIIRADKIDILVDLSGHSAKTRLPLFGCKPAPVQVTWIGSNVTTGIREIDYILCDQWTLPSEEEKYFVEKPWRLPDTWLCFTPPQLDINEGPLPALENGFLTFGCFNNSIKIGDAVVEIWSDILKATPDSRLFLKNRQMNSPDTRQDTLLSFEKKGVPRDRILLEGDSPRAELLASYQKIDVALDPFPFPGGISSMESLWMGVPVLSVKGERFVSHVAESTLHNVGLADWISPSPENLATTATALTSDLAALANLRKRLRQRLLASPLCDSRTFAVNLNNAFRGMWRTWCEQADR